MSRPTCGALSQRQRQSGQSERLKRFVYVAGNMRKPYEAYRQFRGTDPSPDALLRRRGPGEG